MTDSAHIIALKKQDRLNRLSVARRFHITGGKFEKYAADLPAKDTEALVQAAVAAERATNPQPGDLVAGKGIYFGKYALKDKEGNLAKTFNMYAAPADLQAGTVPIFSYDKAVEYIAALRNWHGHNGASYATDRELLTALEEGSYKGEWIIPTREMLKGPDNGGVPLTEGTLFAHRNDGVFQGTFHDVKSMGLLRRDFYWSSTKLDNTQLPGTHMFGARLMDGISSFYNAAIIHFSCRPVRLEPVS